MKEDGWQELERLMKERDKWNGETFVNAFRERVRTRITDEEFVAKNLNLKDEEAKALKQKLKSKKERMTGAEELKRTPFLEKYEERTFWGNLGLALAATLPVGIAFFVIGILVGALSDALTELESTVGTWALFIVVFTVAYIASLIYLLYKSRVRQNRETKRAIDALILYWQEQLVKQNEPRPSDTEIKAVREMLLKRMTVWALLGPELWNRYFPNEKYSEYLFGIVDNFVAYSNKNLGYFYQGEYHLWNE